jgi:dCMP deaminase
MEWNSYFLEIANTVSTRATCSRLKVGAVIVKDKHILSTGYNGSPSKSPHCTEVGCLIENNSCQRTIHAETNAIIQAAKHGVNINNATIYVTHEPCFNCLKHIMTAGISEIYFKTEYGSSPLEEKLAKLGLMDSWIYYKNSTLQYFKVYKDY